MSVKKLNIVFSEETLELQLSDSDWYDPYCIDLELCNNSAQLLDWILQLNCKRWAQPHMASIIDALEDACRKHLGTSLQGAYCPFGASQRVNWRKQTVSGNKRVKP